MKHVILRTREEGGVTYTKWEQYVPPKFPARDYILESLDGIAVLVTPGQRTTYAPDKQSGAMMRVDTAAKKTAAGHKPVLPPGAVIYDGYRPLRDRMHATRMTEKEAFALAEEQGFVLAENCRPGAKATHQLIAL